jgi:hypothetical protein
MLACVLSLVKHYKVPISRRNQILKESGFVI